jgi:hypothetical protein
VSRKYRYGALFVCFDIHASVRRRASRLAKPAWPTLSPSSAGAWGPRPHLVLTTLSTTATNPPVPWAGVAANGRWSDWWTATSTTGGEGLGHWFLKRRAGDRRRLPCPISRSTHPPQVR